MGRKNNYALGAGKISYIVMNITSKLYNGCFPDRLNFIEETERV